MEDDVVADDVSIEDEDSYDIIIILSKVGL